MKRARPKKPSKAKSARKAQKTCLQPEYSLDVPVDIPNVREQIISVVGSEALEMVRSMIEEVRKGHYLAMKYLFEMAGLFPAVASADPTSEDSLTNILLRNLGIGDGNSIHERGTQTKVSKESCPPADEATGHAVK